MNLQIMCAITRGESFNSIKMRDITEVFVR